MAFAYKKMKIYLDAGHRNSTYDFGATNGSIKESVLALSITKKLKEQLKILNHTVYETRTSEQQTISLPNRVKLANNIGELDLFLSIHINSASNTSAQGVEVLHYEGTKGSQMAQKICNEICNLTGQKNRGAKVRNDLYVLKQTKSQALLVECGFISSPDECQKLCNEKFQDKLVQGILKGLGLIPREESDSMTLPYHKIPFSQIKKIDIINVRGGITAKEIMAKYNPDWLCNLALYDVGTMQNMTFLEDENVKSGSYFTSDGIGIIDHKTPIWCTHKEACSREDIYDFVAGSPVLVRDGKPVKDYGNKYSSYVDGSHKRMAVGITSSDELVLLASNYENTPEELRNYALKNIPNLIGFINCDGGGSVHLQNKSKVYKSSSRANCSWLLVYLKDEKPNVPEGGHKVTETKIEVNGVEKIVQAINVDGTNYIKLRDLADDKIFVTYDSVRKIPIVTTK